MLTISNCTSKYRRRTWFWPVAAVVGILPTGCMISGELLYLSELSLFRCEAAVIKCGLNGIYSLSTWHCPQHAARSTKVGTPSQPAVAMQCPVVPIMPAAPIPVDVGSPTSDHSHITFKSGFNLTIKGVPLDLPSLGHHCKIRFKKSF